MEEGKMKQEKPQPPRSSQYLPKAGTKRILTEPSAPNLEKQAAREAGLRQFISPVALTVPGTKVVFDKNIQQFVTKIVAVPVPFIYDSDRKQFVYSPANAGKEKK